MTKSNFVSEENTDYVVSTRENPTNQKRILIIQDALKDLLPSVLNQQFYGEATLTFKVQDGIIQTIRTNVGKSHG